MWRVLAAVKGAPVSGAENKVPGSDGMYTEPVLDCAVGDRMADVPVQ